MLQPTRTKYRKAHKGRIHGKLLDVIYELWSLWFKSNHTRSIISKQIEAARVALTRHMKRQGRVWTRMFPNIPVSKKPVEVRMGKGKGSPEYWACRVKPGRILFEIDGVSEQIAKEALYKASAKLPIKTKFIKRFFNMKKNELKKLTKDQALKNIDKLKKIYLILDFKKLIQSN